MKKEEEEKKRAERKRITLYVLSSSTYVYFDVKYIAFLLKDFFMWNYVEVFFFLSLSLSLFHRIILDYLEIEGEREEKTLTPKQSNDDTNNDRHSIELIDQTDFLFFLIQLLPSTLALHYQMREKKPRR